ncbi:hypothetical protein [Labrys monachus]|uniref:DUF930 domain-containing protein n=1 Tax=Labrys monachus TaxID=217067 RepID=A0ABU0F8I2_9HYPH|nr:hypothetical protein [Labrys monachus]MDQ0390890.1 hypothetical protein [Labrys monachus]
MDNVPDDINPYGSIMASDWERHARFAGGIQVRKCLIVVALVSATLPAMAQARPQLAQMCSSRWPDDYEMQSVCLRQQLDTLEKLGKQDADAPAPTPRKSRRVDWTLCRVEGLEEILFATKTNWSPAEDGTQLLMGEETSKVSIGSEGWSTDDYVFSFAQSTKKRRIEVSVDSQAAPKQHWEGFCILLRPQP